MRSYSPSVSDVRRANREVTRHLPLLALLAAPLCGSAQAMNYEVGTSLICDTRAQVERFVALFSGDPHAAIDAVNAEEQNPTACALIKAAYLRGAKIGMARNGDNAFEIVRIFWSSASTRPSAFGRSHRALISRCSASKNTRCKPVNEKVQAHMIKLFASTGGQCHAA